ncbi:MAG: hypothetical protein JKY51_06570, partial [Opitutaceae bacterium]|nr:hypothetical protein [Opitutaceae bacterium]
MNFPTETKKRLAQLSEDTLAKFKIISAAARNADQYGPPAGATAMASINTMTQGDTVRNLEKIGQEVRFGFHALVREPAIGRVVVLSQNNVEKTYYICRGTTVGGVENLASYRSPIGEMISLPLGDEFYLPDGTTVEIVEKTQLHPKLYDLLWDSENTVVDSDEFGLLTLKSLRALLEVGLDDQFDENRLSRILADEVESENVVLGRRRALIAKIGLRDQPILDQYQSEIFRLPLDEQLLILGPPGTGKTTTLIRRLGQKLDRQYLEADERLAVSNIEMTSDLSHADSWLMFTPTELLKHYLKEAFNQEGVPASNSRIQTWSSFSRTIARSTFRILKTSSGRGSFSLNTTIDSLSGDALEQPINWFTHFDEWQRSAYLSELKKAAENLCENSAIKVSKVGQRLLHTLRDTDDSALTSIFMALVSLIPEVQILVEGLKK